jgi:Flp pilus assembly protein TadG
MRSTVPSTRTSPPRRNLQEGQAIVLVALLILVLFGMLGLAIDSGRSYVDRRDQQAAVDAAALAAGDWYLNTFDINTYAIPKSVQVYQTNLHLYTGVAASHTSGTVGAYSLPWDQYVYDWSSTSGYKLTVVATNTQFNGYQFAYTSTHSLPLAFLQIFGGPTNVSIGATATGIVGNQRQQPAILTLSTANCSLTLTGGAQLTVLGDTYSNGTACVGAGLREAGNCYGAAGSTCSSATYYCYNSSPGFIPYDPNGVGPPVHPAGSCAAGDSQGGPVVPAPTLPDPGYLANSPPYYNTAQTYNQNNRGTWTEMYPGQYPNFHLVGGSASCAFLSAGVYTWTAGYQSDATGSLLSNELKPPDEMNYQSPGMPTPGGAFAPPLNPGSSGLQFWNENGASCSGEFNLALATVPSSYAMKHGGGGSWGIEVTSVRYDRFIDPTITPNSCYNSPGCFRESAPSACQSISTVDTSNQGIVVNITRNAPGAQYYNVYINKSGCDGNQDNFGFVNRYLAPGFTDAGGPPVTALGPYPSGANIVLTNGVLGTACPVVTVTVCTIDIVGWNPFRCNAQARGSQCRTTANPIAPPCFQSCSPPPSGIAQGNAASDLQYSPNKGGDMANENYCMNSPTSGGISSAPCQGTQVTPGAVQFYFPNGSCMTQNATGATYVFGGKQYNWIVIYFDPANTCSGNKLNGGSATQYIGTLYAPKATWTINGGNIAPLAGQVIVFSASVAGGATVGIDFNPNYSPAPPAARLIN